MGGEKVKHYVAELTQPLYPTMHVVGHSIIYAIHALLITPPLLKYIVHSDLIVLADEVLYALIGILCKRKPIYIVYIIVT